MEIRLLEPGDEGSLAGFFAAHPDTTLFLQGNLLAAGLVDRGEPYQARYAGAFDADGALQALAAHGWNGNLLLEAPRALPAVVTAAVDASGRAVAGILGRYAQVRAARRHLGLERAPTSIDSREDLFALELDVLRVPEPVARGAWCCRAPRPEELAALVDWRQAYCVEALRERPGPALRARSEAEMARYQDEARHFVLEVEGRITAYAAFNARTPACVQIGGVWTPPALRSRGYGRAVVAGALAAAREAGVARSVLFTQPDNHAARAAYRALGYRRRGDYGMLLLAAPVPPGAGR